VKESSFLNPHKTLLAAKVHEGMHAADFGAGSGFFTRALAREVGEGGVVWAVDLQADLLPRIKTLATAEGLHQVEVIQGNVEVLGGSNLPDNHFDFCVVANVLFSLEHKGECVAEVRRVLKSGGRALVVDWSGSFGGLGPHKDHIVTGEAARAMFEAQGFTFIEEVPAGLYHWGFVVRKKS